jgi:hypothetical protein
MSSDQYRQQAQTHLQEIARLQRDKAREGVRVAGFQKQSVEASGKAGRASSISSAQSYLRDAQRYSEQAAGAQKNLANVEDKIAREQSRLSDAQRSLAREEQREAENRQREADRQARQHEQRMRNISSTLDYHANTLNQHGALHRRTLSDIEKLAQLPEKITVVLMAANPLDQAQLRLDEEARAIAEMIRKSAHRDSVKLESCWAARPLDVLQALNEHRPRIVHFSGHGSEQDEIVFQDNNGTTKLVSKEAIVQTMAAASGEIRLVFFNTCYSRNQAESVVKHVSAAIGMKTSIGDDAARVFAAQFYSAIGFGLSVKKAFDQAKAALMLEGIAEQDTPELFVADGLDPEQLVLVRPAEA